MDEWMNGWMNDLIDWMNDLDAGGIPTSLLRRV